MNSVKDLNDFFGKDRLILIVEGHEWEGEETTFVCMVNKDGSIPPETQKPSVDLRMRVKTKYGTELDLENKYVFIVEKKITQRPDQN